MYLYPVIEDFCPTRASRLIQFSPDLAVCLQMDPSAVAPPPDIGLVANNVDRLLLIGSSSGHKKHNLDSLTYLSVGATQASLRLANSSIPVDIGSIFAHNVQLTT